MTTPGINWARLPAAALLAGTAVLVGALAGYAPPLAIGTALGIAFVLLVFADLTFGVAAFTTLTFLTLLPTIAGPAVSLPKAAGLLLALSWMAAIATGRHPGSNFLAEHSRLSLLAFIFLAWVGLSTAWAESHHLAITGLYRYALNLALLPIVYAAVRKREHAVLIAAAFLVGATISAAYGLVTQPDVSAAGTNELDRVSGTIGDPNELAAVLVAGLMLVLPLYKAASRSPILQALALAAGGLCTLTVFLTLSRGGFVALGAALLAGIIFGGKSRSAYAVVTVAVVLVGAVYFAAFASPQATDRITASDGGTGRTDIWKVAWRASEAKPVLGVGANNFPVTSIHYLLRPGALQRSDLIVERPEVTHNMYLQVLAELGIVGLVLFLLIIGASLRAALLAAREFARQGDRLMELLARALIVALFGLLAADFFLSGQYGKQLWILLALGPALQGLSWRSRAAGEAEAG